MRVLLLVTILLYTGLLTRAQDYKLEGNEVKINRTILFKTGSAVLNPESETALQIIKKYLDDKTYISLLRVEVHTDNAGEESVSQELSEKRALAVCRKLVSMGVDCKRLIAVGFGSNKPVADNATAEGRSANRRTCFVNAALRGRLIGGLPADGGGKVAGNVCD